MKRLLLEEIWLGGRESPQYGPASIGDVFEPPSKIVNESRLKSKDHLSSTVQQNVWSRITHEQLYNEYSKTK
jgi:hypothetical protein